MTVGFTNGFNYAHFSTPGSKDVITTENRIGMSGSYTTPHKFRIWTELNYNFFTGYAEGYGRPEWHWDQSIAKDIGTFTLSISAHDILGQMRNLSHIDAADYMQDSYRLILGRYVKAQGQKANSGALIASGEDARFDAILSASVLASAVIFLLTGLSLEAWVGVVISSFIIKSGIEMMIETLDDIIGHRADADLTQKIRRLLNEEPEVRGAYDLFLDNYGPDRNYATVHLELPDVMTVEEVDRLTRRVQGKVFKETGVILTGVGVYSYNTGSDEIAAIRNAVQEKVMAHDWALQIHGFHVNPETKELRFDVVTSFDVDPKEAIGTLQEEVQAICPDYTVMITRDVDISD
jgi:hypothetical protein